MFLPHTQVFVIVLHILGRVVRIERLVLVEPAALQADLHRGLAGLHVGLAQVVELATREFQLGTVVATVDGDHGVVGETREFDAALHQQVAVATEAVEDPAGLPHVEGDERLLHIAADHLDVGDTLAEHLGEGLQVGAFHARILIDAAPGVSGDEVAVDGAQFLDVLVRYHACT